jgi:putative transposase
MGRTIDVAIDKELLDQLLAGRDPQDLFAKDGLIAELKKALSERMLAAELDDHLESETEAGIANRRNGSLKKTMQTGSSKLTRDIPRDQLGHVRSQADRQIPAALPPVTQSRTGAASRQPRY